jgi:hypothetical protein
MTILLHELAHKILPPGFVSEDAGSSAAEDNNNSSVVLQNCDHAINDAWPPSK